MAWLGIDIGGANLKAADGHGFAANQPFELWKHPSKLEHELRSLIAECPQADHIAATMTGELADCFATKREGVEAILAALNAAVDHRHVRVYRLDGRLISPTVAKQDRLQVAAANWHALATYCGRFAEGEAALLIDVGSTTCDIIPLADGKVATTSQTDTQRLQSGELVYCGVSRTPVFAMLPSAELVSGLCPVVSEWFATMQDVYLILGEIPEAPHHRDTADAQPATADFAARRLARTVCGDIESVSARELRRIATSAAKSQVEKIAAAMRQVVGRLHQAPKRLIISGVGEFLARKALLACGFGGQVISLADELGSDVSACAPAHALAVLAGELA